MRTKEELIEWLEGEWQKAMAITGEDGTGGWSALLWMTEHDARSTTHGVKGAALSAARRGVTVNEARLIKGDPLLRTATWSRLADIALKEAQCKQQMS